MKKLLFIVEFGEPEFINTWRSSPQSPVFVVAKDYNEAGDKALAYVEYKNSLKPKTVLTEDGSLNKSTNESIKIKAIRLASEEVVW
jgi:hypothetical protein